MDSHLAHLLEAKLSLLIRWKGQRLNLRLRKKISDFNKTIEEHCRTLAKQQWDEVYNSVDGQMRNSKTCSSTSSTRITPKLISGRTSASGPQYAAYRSPAPQAEFPLHALDPSARIHRLPCAMDTSPPAPHKCPSMFPPVPPSLLLPFPSWSRGTETVLTSHCYNKSFTKGRALFSGLGSTSVMARTHLERLLFVQVKNSYSLFSKRNKYAALLVLSSPNCCLEIVCSYIHALRVLLLLSGDIETNPGPATRSANAGTSSDIMSVLSEIQSGQAAILNEMKSIRSTLLEHEEKFEEITKRLSKIEDNSSVIATVKEKVDGLQTLTEQN
ncbi:hypothetical protein HPB51_012160 [Rhipicephalus microplus]|uniref:Uncharacterized protein n=1 Tax=Rhipicephalus microplus TaxID=6941 RepID=A0A9J6DNE4_RHIMP|nr:hypothetical protein HPB51_012160 [Rhipicephalus microplus]